MNATQKRSIRSLLKKVTPQEAVKLTRFTLGQILSAQFAWFTYFCGEVMLWKTRDDFKNKDYPSINTMRDLKPIESLSSIPQLEINKYWSGRNQLFRYGDSLQDIYNDLTNTETI